MIFTLLSSVLLSATPAVHSDYSQALQQAEREKKDLIIHFREDQRLDQALADSSVRERLARFVFLEVPASYAFQGKRLLDVPALADMNGKPGLAVISLHDKNLPTYYQVVSAHPLVSSRYGWVPRYGVEEVKTILDLPVKGTLSQRSMIYAIRVHPERPRSTHGTGHQAFLTHAARHSERQAAANRQHHADLISASAWLGKELGTGVGASSEVVAESWGRVVGGENVLEAAYSCIDAWRQSPGHWSAVSGTHRYYGYDIARGSNDTWYATGIFGN